MSDYIEKYKKDSDKLKDEIEKGKKRDDDLVKKIKKERDSMPKINWGDSIEIDTTHYEAINEASPDGMGNWAFAFDFPETMDEWTESVVYFEGEYIDGLKKAAELAEHLGHETIYVLADQGEYKAMLEERGPLEAMPKEHILKVVKAFKSIMGQAKVKGGQTITNVDVMQSYRDYIKTNQVDSISRKQLFQMLPLEHKTDKPEVFN